MPPPDNSAAGQPAAGLAKLLCILWLAGVAMRMTILAMPPVIPLVHDELHMSETQVGLLIGLPLAIFAIAAVPGSLLIARIGTGLAVILGMVITALAGAARAARRRRLDALRRRHRDRLRRRHHAAGHADAGARMGAGAHGARHRRLHQRHADGRDVLAGADHSVRAADGRRQLAARSRRLGGAGAADRAGILPAQPAHAVVAARPGRAIGGRWWPDWKNPLIWLLGLTFGSNNSTYFATNAFLGDYLASKGQADLLGSALGWLNGSQILALVILFVTANRLQRRAWPYSGVRPHADRGLPRHDILHRRLSRSSSRAAVVGFTTAVTLTATLALPPLLSAPGDVPRNAAGMFTISYTCAVIIPTISGALWDMTGKPWTAFVPLCICAVTLTVLGVVLTRYRPATDPGIVRQ